MPKTAPNLNADPNPDSEPNPILNPNPTYALNPTPNPNPDSFYLMLHLSLMLPQTVPCPTDPRLAASAASASLPLPPMEKLAR